jgi:hypothetical protein
MTEALYRKVMRGKRVTYELAYNSSDWANDLMKPGQFRLVHAYKDGGRRYEYDVTPDTAGFVAAASIARIAMEDAIKQRAHANPVGVSRYTKKQLAVLDECRAKMIAVGALLPTHWMHAGAREISEAAIEAVRSYRP